MTVKVVYKELPKMITGKRDSQADSFVFKSVVFNCFNV